MRLATPYTYVEAEEKLPVLGREAILETIYELGLDESTYIVLGGANMVLRGIKKGTSDIDMLVSDHAFDVLAARQDAQLKHPPKRAISRGADNQTVWVHSQDTPLPISATTRLGDGYYPLSFSEFRTSVEAVSFVPCLPLDHVRRSKEALQRPKDLVDLVAIAEFTGNALALPSPSFLPPYYES